MVPFGVFKPILSTIFLEFTLSGKKFVVHLQFEFTVWVRLFRLFI